MRHISDCLNSSGLMEKVCNSLGRKVARFDSLDIWLLQRPLPGMPPGQPPRGRGRPKESFAPRPLARLSPLQKVFANGPAQILPRSGDAEGAPPRGEGRSAAKRLTPDGNHGKN